MAVVVASEVQLQVGMAQKMDVEFVAMLQWQH